MFKPALADLDPARKAADIGGYIAETGIAPYEGLRTLAALTATGDPDGRIEAARHLTASAAADPTARARVPAALADQASLMVRLADLDAIDPAEIVKLADTQAKDGTFGAASGENKPALIQLAQFGNDTSVQTDGSADTETQTPDTEGPSDTPPANLPASPTEAKQSTDSERGDGIVPDDEGLELSPYDEANYPPEKVARLKELSEALTAEAQPARPTGSLGRASVTAADRNAAALDDAKAAATEAEKEFGELVLSLIPVLGTAIDVKDAVKAFQEAEWLEAEGKLDAALDKRGAGSLAAFGAIPVIGAIAKFPKAAAKFKRLFRETRVGALEPGNPRSFSIPRKTDRKIISQFDQPTCGTASCAMTLNILTGASPDIKDINKAAGLTKNGVKLPDLARVMRNSGVPQATHKIGLSVKELEKAVKGNKPAIVRMNLDRGRHGVVVDGFAMRGGKKFVAVIDPAGETANKPGRAYLVPIDEFSKRFTGEAVLTTRIR